MTGFHELDPVERAASAVAVLARQPDASRVSWSGARTAILEAAGFFREQSGQTSAPVRLCPICRVRRISVSYFPSTDAPEAILSPVLDGFIVRLAPSSRRRQRFSLAHEIGHTFFYDDRKRPPVRLLPWGGGGLHERKEEDICNGFARELLMPRDLVVQAMTGKRPGINLLLALAKTFWVSTEVVIRRLLHDVGEFPACLVLSKDSTKPHPQTFRGRLLRKGLRKHEREAGGLVRKALVDGPPFAAVLSEVKQTVHSLGGRMEWRELRFSPEQYSLIVLLQLRT